MMGISTENEVRLPRQELSKLLAQSVGMEKADELVLAHARGAGLKADAFTSSEALMVLEKIAGEPGLVGVAARFAKSRVHLRWSSGAK